MVREDTVRMSMKELKQVQVIRQAMGKALLQQEAGEVLGLTARQVRRLIQRVRAEATRASCIGVEALPRTDGTGPHCRPECSDCMRSAMGTLGRRWRRRRGPSATGSRSARRPCGGWLLAKGVTHFQRRMRPHRAWRARRVHGGALLQLDGSHHDWFEGRGSRCVLMADIDDASSRVWARFYEYEGTLPAMDSSTRYVTRYGIPLAVYADKPTTNQSPALPTMEESLAGVKPTSQCGRALGELGVELIPAHSPQVKGRIERLFHTFQDRLIKELRLAGIATLEEANRFLEGYLPIDNRRVAMPPAQAADRHRPAPRELDRILCLKTTRCLRKDFTIAHQRGCHQIHETIRAPHVLVEERVDGTMRITHQGRPLDVHAIMSRPVKAAAGTPVPRSRRPVTPRPDHPWRKHLLPEGTSHAAAAIT